MKITRFVIEYKKLMNVAMARQIGCKHCLADETHTTMSEESLDVPFLVVLLLVSNSGIEIVQCWYMYDIVKDKYGKLQNTSEGARYSRHRNFAWQIRPPGNISPATTLIAGKNKSAI